MKPGPCMLYLEASCLTAQYSGFNRYSALYRYCVGSYRVSNPIFADCIDRARQKRTACSTVHFPVKQSPSLRFLVRLGHWSAVSLLRLYTPKGFLGCCDTLVPAGIFCLTGRNRYLRQYRPLVLTNRFRLPYSDLFAASCSCKCEERDETHM